MNAELSFLKINKQGVEAYSFLVVEQNGLGVELAVAVAVERRATDAADTAEQSTVRAR